MNDEIRKAPIVLYPSESFTNGTDDDCHVFTQDHTLNDILRYAVSQANGDFEEIETLLGLLKERNDR